jgi:PAS domain S-box-containing protein
MEDPAKTTEALVRENGELWRRIHELESSEANLRQEKAALEKSQERYRLLSTASPDPLFVITNEGRYAYGNAAFAGALGFAIDEIAGKTLWDVFPKDEADRRFAAVTEVIRTGRAQAIEGPVSRPDGERWYATTIMPAPDQAGLTASVVCTAKDITDRRLAEEALRQSEEKYRLVVENVGEAIAIIQNGGARFVNSRAVEITGYSKTELLTTPFDRFLHPDDCQMVLERYGRRVQGEAVPGVYPFRFVTKGGAVKWVELHATVVSWNGMPATLNFFIDITDRRRAEETLRALEDQYRAIFETTGTTMLVADQEMRILLVNRGFEKLVGFSREEVEGKMRWTERVHPDDLPAMVERHRLRREDSALAKKSYEFRLVQRDGGIRNILLTVDLIPGTQLSVASLIDLTERYEAEAAADYQRRLIRQVIDADPNLIFVKDLEGRFLLANRAMAALFGRAPDEMIGRTDEELGASPEDAASHRKDDLEVIGQGLRKVIPEERCASRAGEGRCYRTTKVPLEDDAGRRTRVLAVGVDITDHKRMEESLARAEKMESLGRLAGGVAHDLNNVLGVLTGYAELLSLNLPEGTALKRYAESILKSSTRGAVIIQDLLTLARRGVTVSEVVDLNAVVSDVLRSPECEKLMSFHPRVRVRTDLQPGLLKVKGSPVHLGKTVMNLFSNAAEAMAEGGEVTIRTENRCMDRPDGSYESVRDGDYVVLTVADSGQGISPADLDKIFEPFYTKKVMGRSGTGLGLAVVWGTVKDHKGYIDVTSQEGRGTVFSLYFPVTREALPAAQEAPPQATYQGRGETILVVDDRAEQRELAATMLGWLGYRVEAAASGEEAVAWLAEHAADLVVLDMIMEPGIDGLDTYRRMTSLRPGQKAIIVSGFSETERVRQMQALGAGAFIRKPYVLEKIGLAVREALDRPAGTAQRAAAAVENEGPLR